MPKGLSKNLLRLLGLEAEELAPQIAPRIERALPPELPPVRTPSPNLPMLRPPPGELELLSPLRSSADDVIETTARSVDDVVPQITGSTPRPSMGLGKKALLAGTAGAGLYTLLGDSEQPPTPLASPEDTTGPSINMAATGRPEDKKPPTEQEEIASLREKMKALGVSGQPNVPSTEPRSGMTEIDVGEGEIGTVAGLQAAQERRRRSDLMADLSESADLLGSGISGRQALPKGTFDSFRRQGEREVSDFLAQVEQQKHDPGSPSSKAFREYLKKFNINVKGDFTAALGEKIMPVAMRAFEAEESRKQREFLAGENRKTRSMDLLSRMEEKKEKEQTRKTEKEEGFKSDLRKELISGPGKDLYNAYVKSSLSVERLRDAVKNPSGYKDLGNIYNYLKALDPDSAVREGELALGIKVGSIPQKLHASFVRFLTGEMLDPSQRKQMLEVVEGYHRQNQQAYETYIEPTVAQGKRLGYDMTEIVRPLQSKTEAPAPTEKSSKKLRTIQNMKTGTKKTIPADRAEMYLKDPNFQEVK